MIYYRGGSWVDAKIFDSFSYIFFFRNIQLNTLYKTEENKCWIFFYYNHVIIALQSRSNNFIFSISYFLEHNTVDF